MNPGLTCAWKEPVKKLRVMIKNRDSAFFKKSGITIGVPKNTEKDEEAERFLIEFSDSRLAAFSSHEIVFF